MNDNVKITLSVKAQPEVARAAMLAATRVLREGVRAVIDPGHAHTISDPGHSHGIVVPTQAAPIVDPHLEMMARNLMTVRALPCDHE